MKLDFNTIATMPTAQREALVEALDQYCANQTEYEETEDETKPYSAKLYAALEMQDCLTNFYCELADLPQCTTEGCNHVNCSEAAIEAEVLEHAAQLQEQRRESYQDE